MWELGWVDLCQVLDFLEDILAFASDLVVERCIAKDLLGVREIHNMGNKVFRPVVISNHTWHCGAIQALHGCNVI